MTTFILVMGANALAISFALIAFLLFRSRGGVAAWVFAALSFLCALANLVFLHGPVLVIVLIAFSIGTIICALLAFLLFRWNRVLPGTVFAVLALFFLLADVKGFQFRKMRSSKPPMPVETVSSAVVQEVDWAPTLTAVGSVSAVQGAVVSSELGGVVAEIKFQNGGVAKKDDVLVRLAATSEDADLALARSDLMRTRDLAARKVISKAELDAAESKLKQKEGAVEKKEVRAPFDGQLGIRQVNVGQMINAGQQVVPLQALDTLYVDFAVPQQELGKLSPGLEVRVHSDAVEGKEFVGKLTAINSSVDAVTRNVTLQATIDNKDHTLRPGMFAKAEVVLPTKERTLIVPGTAVSYAPYGDSVFVIEKKKDEKTGKESQAIRQQFVRVGEARGDFVSITKGLKAGDTVVGTGVFKLRNGMAVTINNDLAPKPQLNPTPVDS